MQIVDRRPPSRTLRAAISAFPGTLLRHYAAPAPDGSRSVQKTGGPRAGRLPHGEEHQRPSGLRGCTRRALREAPRGSAFSAPPRRMTRSGRRRRGAAERSSSSRATAWECGAENGRGTFERPAAPLRQLEVHGAQLAPIDPVDDAQDLDADHLVLRDGYRERRRPHRTRLSRRLLSRRSKNAVTITTGDTVDL